MALAAALLSPAVRAKEARVHHVLLISVDGLHQRDLARFIADHPASALSRLSRSGVTWDDARATTPSDSFPGLLALVTGGTPKSTGVYYDDSYDRTLYPPGSNCQGAAGSEIVYDESDDFDMDRLFSGGINPKNLPLQKDASGCHPLYPHSFLRVNTIFEVAKAAGLRTAWSDKHPSYDLVNGPSGNGVDDLYTPEINSLIVNRFVEALERRHLLGSTAIVVSAKHGQSPMDFSKLAMEGGGHAPVQSVRDPIDFVNNADPNVDSVVFTNNDTTGPTKGHAYATAGHLQTDDVGLLWLQDQSEKNRSAVVAQLRGNSRALFADKLPDDPDDTHVALLISVAGVEERHVAAPVETTQVAPTILRALGLDPRELQAVREEHTKLLTGAPF